MKPTSGELIAQAIADERQRIIGLIKWETRPAELSNILNDVQTGELRSETAILYIIKLIEGKK